MTAVSHLPKMFSDVGEVVCCRAKLKVHAATGAFQEPRTLITGNPVKKFPRASQSAVAGSGERSLRFLPVAHSRAFLGVFWAFHTDNNQNCSTPAPPAAALTVSAPTLLFDDSTS